MDVVDPLFDIIEGVCLSLVFDMCVCVDPSALYLAYDLGVLKQVRKLVSSSPHFYDFNQTPDFYDPAI